VGHLAHGQFGLSYSYMKNNPSDWQEVVDRQNNGLDLFESGWSAGFNYWFRLRNYRWEFLPEIAYRKNSTEFNQGDDMEKFNLDFYQFQVHTQIYIFDIEGDCNCPTFSKDGNFFTKGFFVSISPGLSLAKQQYELLSNSTGTEITQDENDLAYHLGLGAGMDVGLTDLITVTPFVQWKKYFGLTWENFENLLDPFSSGNEGDDSGFTEINLGIRLGLRLDYDN
jgi:hypothetical protein